MTRHADARPVATELPAFVDHVAYDRIVQAYRDGTPGNARECARRTGHDPRTCRRAWKEGWPARGLRPVAEVLEEEATLARARLHEQREAELRERAAKGAEELARAQAKAQAAAQEDAVQSRAQEAQMVRAARMNSMGLLAVTGRLLKGANELAKRVETTLAAAGAEGKEGISPLRATQLFREIASTTRAANEAAKLAQQMERSLLGEPDKWIGLRLDSLTEAEAVHEIELAARAAARARARGVTVETDGTAVQGGGGVGEAADAVERATAGALPALGEGVVAAVVAETNEET